MTTRADEVDLHKAVLALHTLQEVEAFLEDLLSPDEIARLVKRWQVFSLVAEGLTKAEIHTQIGASGATISRARRAYKTGTGIVDTVLGRLAQKEANSLPNPDRSDDEGLYA